MRNPGLVDRIVTHADDALRVVFGPPAPSANPNPAGDTPDVEMDESTRRHAAGLMRINHTGEVCAQALYAGQAATARSNHVRLEMEQAAREEEDHLAWCAERLDELDSRASLLNPLWYGGSFALGALAGLAGDSWSLGFVQATERQVEAHLGSHLVRLPENDQRSRKIVEQMKIDEARHADMAEASGARTLPAPFQSAMGLAAGVMKVIVYRV